MRAVVQNHTERYEISGTNTSSKYLYHHGTQGFVNLWMGTNYLERGDNPTKARQIIDEGLNLIPLDSIAPISRPYSRLIILSARLGEIEQAKSYLDEYESLVPAEVRKSDFFRWVAVASIQEAEGDFSGALETLHKVETIDHCGVCFTPYFKARIMEKMDSVDAAIDLYTKFQDITWASAINLYGEERPIAYFRLGELYSIRGDIDAAIEAYSRFVDYWKAADPAVQPRVQYAMERIDALLDQKAREPQ